METKNQIVLERKNFNVKYAALADELHTFHGANGGHVCINRNRLALTEKLKKDMETFAAAHPSASAHTLRSKIYDLIAAHFQPVLFRHSPFYAELGGNGGWNQSGLGRWLLTYNVHILQEAAPEVWKRFGEQGGQRYFLCCGPFFDAEHNSPPLSNVLKKGFGGIYAEAQDALTKCQNQEEKEFVGCAIKGLLAVKAILERYAEAAGKRLGAVSDTEERHFLAMIAEHAALAPWNPPETFYEGLNALWFVREIMGEMDGLMTNSLGRPDAMLIELYRRDLADGRLTPDEAYDLICRFLLHGDCLYDHDVTVTGYGDHENEIVFTLGGCDRGGNEVFNDLTRMFLRAHRELNLIYPKPHCRFSARSSPEYLKLIADDMLSGRGVYSLLNDDCIIDALVKDGKSLEDAREYSCTGCWDLAVDSREDNAGGNYFSLARIMEATIHDDDEIIRRAGVTIRRIDEAPDFATVYNTILQNALDVLRGMMAMEGQYGQLWSKAAPGPLNSACSLDCLEKRKDFTAGGQRYNPHAVSLCFFANFLDSLLAIQDLCFARKACTLPELLAAVRRNWQGAESLRQQVLNAPHWGDARTETTDLARRLHEDIYAHTRDLRNERGGVFQLGYWIYREFRLWGEKMKALPDGRHDGDYLSQSLNPSHFRNDQDVTTVLQGLAQIDLAKSAANSVVNLVLDKTGLTPEIIDGLLRSFARLKLQLLQLNCTSRKELLDAQKHPEQHQDLIVRICGFSAKFTSLSREWQNEIISRKEY